MALLACALPAPVWELAHASWHAREDAGHGHHHEAPEAPSPEGLSGGEHSHLHPAFFPVSKPPVAQRLEVGWTAIAVQRETVVVEGVPMPSSITTEARAGPELVSELRTRAPPAV